MKAIIKLCILTAGISSLAAQAQDRERPKRPQRPDPAEIFAQADSNEDGFVNLKELEEFRANMPQGRRGGRGEPQGENVENDAAPPSRQEGQRGRGRTMPTAEEMMASLDKDKDGKLGPEEFVLANRRGRGPGGPSRGEGQRAKKPE